jgi:hypothetical protein
MLSMNGDFPKSVKEMTREVDQKDWQADTVSSRISSGIILNLMGFVRYSA